MPIGVFIFPSLSWSVLCMFTSSAFWRLCSERKTQSPWTKVSLWRCNSTTGRCCAAWNISKSHLEDKVHTRTNKHENISTCFLRKQRNLSLYSKNINVNKVTNKAYLIVHTLNPLLSCFFSLQLRLSELIDLYDKGGTKGSYLKDAVP